MKRRVTLRILNSTSGGAMKKIISTMVIIAMISVTLAPAAIAGGRGHGYRYHGHYRHYHGGYDNFWIGLGLGVITGAIVSGIYSTPPPPRRVVYYDPPPVVVSRTPVSVQPKSYGKALKPTFGMVIVTAAELNLRSGPGLDRAVVGRVRKGDILGVIDSIPSWFYVRNANGRYGWVMDRYTKPSGPVG
jgi:uncharacterized protein YgiM (DUF1202 family)